MPTRQLGQETEMGYGMIDFRFLLRAEPMIKIGPKQQWPRVGAALLAPLLPVLVDGVVALR